MISCRLVRDSMTASAPTLGRLYAGALDLYTLEDAWRGNARNVSCIPEGTYRVVLAWSERFQRAMPYLRDVPDRSAILIHSGNRDSDTTGCILVGLHRTPGGVLFESRRGLDLFTRWFGIALRTEDVSIVISTGGGG